MRAEDADAAAIAARVRQALETRDLHAFGALLAEDVRWGDDDLPQRCRGPADVLQTLRRGLEAGAEADVVEVTAGRGAVLCQLLTRWPAGSTRPPTRRIFHVYRLDGGRIGEILAFDDRRSAAEAAGIDG